MRRFHHSKGTEAGAHRGSVGTEAVSHLLFRLFALLPPVLDNKKIPLVSKAGIREARSLAAALFLKASKVQIC